ncbi:hypothetical protein AK812_SmicGene6826 [Symbiodinium microadriaticum]|uniref:Uncharacterized protein n=1 Tax=Symbiodinium microadriaticum TaxID=2951 RepID=A0A1Q9EQ35_SYMMI|nr:hypothetical protein AK812_SmicGene6826 [Symbiodinium microadriaticum]
MCRRWPVDWSKAWRAEKVLRFTGEAGAIQRDSRLLLGYQCDIHLPVFEGLDDTAVQCLPYKVVAMQLHYGEVPQRDTTAAF